MKNIREAVRDVIVKRILPGIERDGISKLILPEQITPDDCAEPMKCRQPCGESHPEHELAIGLAGKATYCINDKRFLFTPGRIALLPGGTPHAPDQKTVLFTGYLDPTHPASNLWLTVYPFGIRVQVSHMTEETDTMTGTLPFVLLDWHFNRLVTWLLEEVRSAAAHYAGVGRCILMEIMHRCLRASGATVEDSRPTPSSYTASAKSALISHRKTGKADSEQPAGWVRTAQEFIHSHYNLPIDLDDIAEAADVSATHLTRKFKAATGQPPIKYLLNVRMAVARQMLRTDLKILEIARLVGIDNQYYFSRLFKQITTLSPLQYRREMTRPVEHAPKSKKTRKRGRKR